MTERQPIRFIDPFEAWLATGLATELAPDVADRIDRRVRSAIAVVPIPLAQRRARFGRRSRVLLLVAATIAVMGAGAGIFGLFGTIFGPVEGWRTAFDRAERLDVAVTSGDVRATVIRAYADANQVFVFMVSENLRDQQQPSFDGLFTLVDETGTEYQPLLAGGAPDQSIAAAMFVFWTPEPWLDGSRTFTFTVPFFRDPRAMATDPSPDAGRIPGGPYTFTFALTSQGGRVVEPGQPVVVNGTTVGLRSLALSATAARGVLTIDPAPAEPGEPLRLRITVQAGGRSVEVATYEGVEGSKPLLVPFATVSGFEDPAGAGTVEVRVVGPDGTEAQGERWVLPFELP
jgi:hypothetical protein